MRQTSDGWASGEFAKVRNVRRAASVCSRVLGSIEVFRPNLPTYVRSEIRSYVSLPSPINTLFRSARKYQHTNQNLTLPNHLTSENRDLFWFIKRHNIKPIGLKSCASGSFQFKPRILTPNKFQQNHRPNSPPLFHI